MPTMTNTGIQTVSRRRAFEENTKPLNRGRVMATKVDSASPEPGVFSCPQIDFLLRLCYNTKILLDWKFQS